MQDALTNFATVIEVLTGIYITLGIIKWTLQKDNDSIEVKDVPVEKMKEIFLAEDQNYFTIEKLCDGVRGKLVISSTPLDEPNHFANLATPADRIVVKVTGTETKAVYGISEEKTTGEYDRLYQKARELGVRGLNTRWKLETLREKLAGYEE